jgi:hypothetical protein
LVEITLSERDELRGATRATMWRTISKMPSRIPDSATLALDTFDGPIFAIAAAPVGYS